MQLVTPRFGTLEIDEASIITFPSGLPGFEHCKRFKLLHQESPDPVVMWLQSVDDTAVVLNVLDASMLGLPYKLDLDDAESALINWQEGCEILLLLTLSRDTGESGIRANMQSPIVLNASAKLAFQKTGVQPELVFNPRN
ncbi:flagellar assembly protein FliW [Chitinimonas sp. BJYL2]|uniref:flagellar assembly protein FliW n=1 Tax=Chitinimonas sp. BJYL2 TaxID=2976696 RepID=UPI0022B38EEB|nr:flagellar assembly protein FliW [Chitinimonas sp. BJYL2]